MIFEHKCMMYEARGISEDGEECEIWQNKVTVLAAVIFIRLVLLSHRIPAYAADLRGDSSSHNGQRSFNLT
jgi:hypothetical protein